MFIKHLKDELGWDDDHFKNFLRKYYKKTDINTLTKEEGIKIIESLKNVIKHRRAQPQ